MKKPITRVKRSRYTRARIRIAIHARCCGKRPHRSLTAAQDLTGALVGTVKDEQNAVLPRRFSTFDSERDRQGSVGDRQSVQS
jgi:hypothetical protein